MDNTLFTSYLIEERSYVSFVKREIHNLVLSVFGETRTGEIDIVVSELTSNLIKYVGNGELLYRMTTSDEGPLFELLCIDNGPGMRNVSHSIRDGFSTTSSLGQGMGSIMRLSDHAQVYSQLEWGTIVYACFRPTAREHKPKTDLLIRCLNVAKPGEQVSGDGYTIKTEGTRTVILVGDGLGHGPHAHEVTEMAIAGFERSRETDPPRLLREVNEQVRKTRGLVGTIALLDRNTKTWSICGIGNIGSRLYHGLEYKNYICYNGIIGLNIPSRIASTIVPAERYQQLILCSDGIRTRWDLLQYPSILKYDPMILAAAIYKDHARKTDDMTILIAKMT
jgi:anti-sigma regulatory factor (Ser/Thr protein kinase)